MSVYGRFSTSSLTLIIKNWDAVWATAYQK